MRVGTSVLKVMMLEIILTNFKFILNKMEEFNFEFTREQLLESINDSRLIPCNGDSVMREVRKSGLVKFDKKVGKYVKKN